MNLNEIVQKGKTQSGKDPELERKAEEAARKAWSFDFKGVLKKVYGDNYTAEVAAKYQAALIEHKYEAMESAEETRSENKKQGLHFAM